MKYVIGIDLGTGSLKAVVMNPKGDIVDTASSAYVVSTPQPGFSEQNPGDWVKAFQETIKALVHRHPDLLDLVEGISFSGQMHSLVLLDKTGAVLRPAILWNDVRTHEETHMMNQDHLEMLLEISKNQALEGFTLPKLLWVQRHEPHVFAQIDSILLPKDYLRYVLTGHKNMDYSDAAGTLLLDVETKTWSADLCETFAINPAWLPPLVASSDVCGMLRQDCIPGLTINKAIAVMAGGADNACAAIASGLVSKRDIMLSIGTSGVVLAVEPQVVDYHGKLHFFNHCMPHYYSMGVTLSAGASLNWFKETFAKDDDFASLLTNVSAIKPGSDGLLFTPYIVGERSPYFDAHVRGAFLGIDVMHTKNHFARSVLEGITYSLKNSFDMMQSVTNREFDRIISVGGGAKNSEWLQMQADIFNLPVSCLEVEEGPALGAAMLAAMGVKWFDSFEACIEQCVRIKPMKTPQKNAVLAYHDYYQIYNDCYQATRAISHRLITKRTTA